MSMCLFTCFIIFCLPSRELCQGGIYREFQNLEPEVCLIEEHVGLRVWDRRFWPDGLRKILSVQQFLGQFWGEAVGVRGQSQVRWSEGC